QAARRGSCPSGLAPPGGLLPPHFNPGCIKDMTDLFGGAPTIKALSVWEPWASLIATGVKRHETRHWETTYRGPIAIQAAKTLDLAGAPDQLCQDVLGPLWPKGRPHGCVVAVAYLSDCIPTDRVLQELTAADRE